jgi:GNAT superfamily N-acetyltransferase
MCLALRDGSRMPNGFVNRPTTHRISTRARTSSRSTGSGTSGWCGSGTDLGRSPRLGLIGVLPGYRRLGLAKALIAQAFDVLLARGAAEVTAEADRTNTASTALLAQLGGVVTGSDVELCRS